ncbi:MAG TPA: hypothetical protein VF503_29380 [Sphingobium sp.]|uniref:hypothetical protein n=1 Tax=Sphingobium sp. TaxID=1912891 RepID=UPI002ED3158C
MSAVSAKSNKSFKIFRAAESPMLERTGVIEFFGMMPAIDESMAAFEEAGDGASPACYSTCRDEPDLRLVQKRISAALYTHSTDS